MITAGKTKPQGDLQTNWPRLSHVYYFYVLPESGNIGCVMYNYS
jgi:hypothetical protein